MFFIGRFKLRITQNVFGIKFIAIAIVIALSKNQVGPYSALFWVNSIGKQALLLLLFSYLKIHLGKTISLQSTTYQNLIKLNYNLNKMFMK